MADFDFNNLKEQFTNPQDVSDMFTQEDINQNKWVAVAATFPILFWIPIVAKPESGFGKFYANQGLIFLLLTVALNIANGILGALLGLIPFIGGLLAAVIAIAVSACILLVWVFLIVNAASGKAAAIPLIGNLFTAFK